MSENLKPCPFCGGEAQVQHHSRELYGDVVDWYGVYCKKQFCGYVSGQSTEAEAIAAWNSRAAYETDGYFLLPKPKERLYSLTGPVFSDDYTKASFGVSVVDDAVKRWQHQIEENMERELISRICEVFGNERASRKAVD